MAAEKDDSDELYSDFSSELRAELYAYFPSRNSSAEAPAFDPAKAFVAQLLDVGRWARDELREIENESTRQQLRAEQTALVATLRAARDALCNLSSDLDRLLGPSADPIGCVAAIDALLVAAAVAGDRIHGLSKSERQVEKEGTIAKEFTTRIAGVLTAHGMKASASGDAYFEYSSTAIEILRAIGTAVGLDRAALTWRNILAAAKSAARGP